ncbi:Histidine triad (HIT) family protein [Desulfonema limicola]|uniref:Histidine triad (HIT) family protein n=1 Tax=Desulfonema limicola TaxID=45656 RepID=A0A975BAA9_9BACT|nr:histidine triad nucleotide-binding protein [Desulfonema limicola]QTA81655.1 Histidine triad (HIT) family protein [Desulfonema limicola]
MEKTCLFCNIANNQTEKFLYENDKLVVFKDIKPSAPVHLLIVPKKHIRSINDISEFDGLLIGEMMIAAKKMAEEQGIAKSGYKLLFNVEKGGGQVIFHLHLHLIGGWKSREKNL